ncbi:MAG: gluconokinase [Leucobacter sp.]
MIPSSAASTHPVPIVVMGVSGVGKTTIGIEIARRLGRAFIDADHLHPETNRRKMESGVPLDDSDREPWLSAVGEAILEETGRGSAPVVACSALKAEYRELLRDRCPEIAFVHLDGDPEVIDARLRSRSHEYMPAALLPSQLQTLEPPIEAERAIRIDIESPVDVIASEAIDWLRALESADTEENR